MALLLVPNGDYLIAFPVAYMTIYLGLLNPGRQKLLLSGDYSYGIFLYGYPIQQAVAAFGPVMHEWYWTS
jgi:peptidoglycan/LPS O-acetylase OafA/YrhL